MTSYNGEKRLASATIYEFYQCEDKKWKQVSDVFGIRLMPLIQEIKSLMNLFCLICNQVNAIDPDIHRNPSNDIEYSLSQDDAVINSLFSINRNTGEIFIRGELDRDKPDGRDVYRFTVLAVDEPAADSHLTGYATVQVFPIDINDNSPQFDSSSLIGSVKEMSATGIKNSYIKMNT